jgi:sulfur carrier protein
MSVEITLNGEPRELAEGTSVESLVQSLGGVGGVGGRGNRGIAVAVDGEVVLRGAWAATALGAGARIEVVVAVQGG